MQQVSWTPVVTLKQTSPELTHEAAVTGAAVVVGVQEKPAISWHDHDPQLVLKIPQRASQRSVQSCPLHLDEHWFFASAQQKVLQDKRLQIVSCYEGLLCISNAGSGDVEAVAAAEDSKKNYSQEVHVLVVVKSVWLLIASQERVKYDWQDFKKVLNLRNSRSFNNRLHIHHKRKKYWFNFSMNFFDKKLYEHFTFICHCHFRKQVSLTTINKLQVWVVQEHFFIFYFWACCYTGCPNGVASRL